MFRTVFPSITSKDNAAVCFDKKYTTIRQYRVPDESKTVHTAKRICQTDFAECLLAGTRWNRH